MLPVSRHPGEYDPKLNLENSVLRVNTNRAKSNPNYARDILGGKYPPPSCDRAQGADIIYAR